MKIGLVGYQGSGKSTLFHWLTGAAPDPSLTHTVQSAMATVTDPRVEQLCAIYNPKKVTHASLEIVDTPGLSRNHEGSAGRLAQIREAGCLVIVVGAFAGADPRADTRNFEDDLLIADLDIVAGRVERLREALKKPRPNQEEQREELAALEPLRARLEQGQALHDLELTVEQRKAVKSFQLFTQKPRMVLVNTSELEEDPGRLLAQLPEGAPAAAAAFPLQLELSRMAPGDRAAFCQEMGVKPYDREQLLRDVMAASGQMLFFTAGEKEVRTWLVNQGATAVEAAGEIHTDLARGFVRAEVMQCADLIRLGSEREVKAHNLYRREHKEYVLRDGDIVLIQHNA